MSAIKFLGSSVINYQGQAGWGGTPSELRISLVDDPADGDSFLPISNPLIYLPGIPLLFQHGAFKFGGIMQSYELERNSSANPIYHVSMFDPRIILEGVQLILEGFNGSTDGIPNLINVFGVLEDQGGFGYSQINDSGIPWGKVVEAINYVMNNYSNYGGKIKYRGYEYGIYISQLPNIPEHYRVGGGSISFLDFIQDICEAGAFDWTCSLEGDSILISTINRAESLSTYGAITNYALNAQAHSTNAGTELINNVTSKFVVGGSQDRMYYNFANDYGNDTEDEGAEDNTIWPFWGFDGEDIDGTGANAIVAQGLGDDQTFTIDARGWAIYGLGDWYKTDVYEMRAALDSQEAWESLLWLRNDIYDSPQYQKATKVGIIGDINQALTTILGQKSIEEFAKITALTFSNMTSNAIMNSYNFDHNKNVKTLYDYIRGHAEEHYGRKYMVRVPFVYSSKLPETDNLIRFSEQPTETAYIDGSSFAQGIDLGFIPYDFTKFVSEEEKFYAYVRFDNVVTYDFSEISDSDKFPVQKDGIWYMFIKCQVDSHYVFLNKYTNFSPRALVTLPGIVKYKAAINENLFCGIIYDYLLYEMTRPTRNDAITIAEARPKADTILKSIGGDILQMGKESKAIAPTMAAIPLRSNVLCYGPWYSQGGEGKVEFERDESLVPWNFGGYSLMNDVANAKVSDAFSNQLLSETGSITVPGAPAFSLGGQLVAAGPYISDISCSIGQDGLTTTYNMRIYTPDFGKMRKYNVDRMSKLAKVGQQFRNKFREFYNKKNKNSAISNVKNSYFKSLRAKRDKSHSSHVMICGQVTGTSGLGYNANVLSQPAYNTTTQLSDNYESKAGVSWDGLFRPFSTDTTASGIAHYESASGGYDVSVQSLNPYRAGHDIQAVVHGDTLPKDLVIDNLITPPNTSSYRPMALRGPLVISGWGYDTEDNPVPAKPLASGQTVGVSGVVATFAENFLQRSDLWKTGPVDIRWDNNRKVWVANGDSAGPKLVKVTSSGILPPSGAPSIYGYSQTYRCQVLNAGEDSLVLTGDYIYARNFRNSIIITGRTYLAHKIGTKYFLDVYSEFTDGTT